MKMAESIPDGDYCEGCTYIRSSTSILPTISFCNLFRERLHIDGKLKKCDKCKERQ